MAGRLTQWGAGELLRSFFSRTATPPPSFWLGLVMENAPSPYVIGAELDEPEGLSYSRVEILNDIENWPSDNGLLHVVANGLAVSFVTAQEDWGRIGYWAVCNAQEDGYVYLVGEMEEEQSVLTGDQVIINSDELVVELGPFFTPDEF